MATAPGREERLGEVTPELLREWASELEVEEAKLIAAAKAMEDQRKAVAKIDGYSKFARSKQTLVVLNANVVRGISLAPQDSKK